MERQALTSDDEAPRSHESDGHGHTHHDAHESEMGDEKKIINMVTLYLSCKNLPNLDYGSETDPFIRVYIREDHGKEVVADSDWNLLGQTETQQNVLNP